jgi:hypothetical protein
MIHIWDEKAMKEISDEVKVTLTGKLDTLACDWGFISSPYAMPESCAHDDIAIIAYCKA